VLATRNFYGVLRVQEFSRGTSAFHRSLIHGTIMHGTQYLDPEFERQPTSYYTPTSGIGRAIESLHPTLKPLKVGVIGLGAGTIAAYGSKGDVYRFYDINPAVVDIARSDFTFISKSDANIEIALGDARLNLEREPPQGFDVLAIDAFSSDAIPVHLITSEALRAYRRHMRPGGIIAFHVTNRYLNLIPVVQQLAETQGLRAVLVTDDGDGELASRSDWVLLSENGQALEAGTIDDGAEPIEPHPDSRLWTDDFNNIFEVLKK
jgi:SAM-dependent methyltransferase